MQAASRESLRTARERLDTAAAGVPSEARVRLATDLRTVAAVLAAEPGLRRALSDGSRPEEGRVALLDELFGSRLGPEALDVLRAVVAARWSRPVDLVEAVELLTVDAELAEAEAAGSLAEVEDELFRFAQILAGNPRLGGVLNDPTAAADRRAELVRQLLSDRADPVTVRLATLAVYGYGGRNVDAALQRLVERAAARRDRQIAYVTVAADLSPAQHERLAGRLATIYGRDISLKVDVDTDVLGGARVRIGDDLYDGSVARRLDQARAALAG